MSNAAAIAMPETAPAAVDLGHLRRYTMGNRDLELEVLGLFVDQAAANLHALRTTTSPKVWRDVSHTLKGAALGIGAWSVAKCSQEVEAAQIGDTKCADLIGRLEDAVAEATAFIARLKP